MCNIMKVNKTAIVYHKSDLDGVVSAAIATMYENSKNKDVIYIPYSYEKEPDVDRSSQGNYRR